MTTAPDTAPVSEDAGNDLEVTGEHAHARMVSSAYVEALGYAAGAHVAHVRKGSAARRPSRDGLGAGVPYLAHLMEVSALVLDAGGSDTAAIAALLHDVVEDQGGESRRAEVEQVFGPEVEAIVRACSDSTDAAKKASDYWFDRKRAHVRHIAHVDADTAAVLAADKISNGRTSLADLAALGGPSAQLTLFESFRPFADAAGTRPHSPTPPRAADPFADIAPTPAGVSDSARRYAAACTLWYYLSVRRALGARNEILHDPPLRRLLLELDRVVDALAELVAGLGVDVDRVADRVAADEAAGWPDPGPA